MDIHRPGDVVGGMDQVNDIRDVARTRLRLRRNEPLIAAGISALTLLLLSPPAEGLLIGALKDDAVYLTLGKAIAQGNGYRSIHLVGDPVQVKYPPGLPMLFAILWWIGGNLPNVIGMVHLLNILVIATAAGLLWRFGRERLQIPPVYLAVFAIGPLFLEASLQYSPLAISEPYLLLAWTLILVLIGRIPPQNTAPAIWGTPISLGLVLAAAMLFRTQAVALAGAVLLTMALLRTGWRSWLLCLAALLVPLAVWHLLHQSWIATGPLSTLPDETSYSEWVPNGSLPEFVQFVSTTVRTNLTGHLHIFSFYASGTLSVGLGMWRVSLHWRGLARSGGGGEVRPWSCLRSD